MLPKLYNGATSTSDDSYILCVLIHLTTVHRMRLLKASVSVIINLRGKGRKWPWTTLKHCHWIIWRNKQILGK